jgi:hypothetical protein
MPRSRRPRKPVPPLSQPPEVPEPSTHTKTSDQIIPKKKDYPTLLTPVPEKIGEGKNNLQGRANAFKRRRGTTR